MRTYIVVASFVGAILTSVRAQDTDAERSLAASIAAILRGDIEAVVAAERSGDRSIVFALLWRLQNGASDSEFAVAATRAIRALADRQQLQQIWCSTTEEDSPFTLAEPLGIIGGWFGVRGLQELLKPERQLNYQRSLLRAPSDLMFRSPSGVSVGQLEKLLPEARASWNAAGLPLPPNHEVHVERMNDWINQHKADLERLEPTGEGVDFSERACKGRKPVGL